MTTVLEPPRLDELHLLGDDDLRGLAGTAYGDAAAEVLASRHAKPRIDPVTSEWRDMAYSQYLAAENACNGVLLNHRGIAAGVDPWSLWQGNQQRVDAYASWELREYFLEHPRITVTGYRRQVTADRRAERDDAVDADDTGDLRHRSEGARASAGGAVRGVHPGPRTRQARSRRRR